MKKLLLFGLSASFLVPIAAHAQQTSTYQSTPYIVVVPALPILSAAKGLEEVAGNTGIFSLQVGTYDAKDLLETLTSKTGGHAIFTEEFNTKSLSFRIPMQGTAPELIKKLTKFGIAAGKIGTDWVFVPVENKTPVQGFYSQFLSSQDKTPNLRALIPGPKNSPLADGFNKNPNPGQNLPSNALPFDFNGNRVYRVPLHLNLK